MHATITSSPPPPLSLLTFFMQCGWCGAVNDLQLRLQQQQQHQLQPAQEAQQQQVQLQLQQQHWQPQQLQQRTALRRWLSVAFDVLRWLLVAFVIVLVGSIATLGVVALLPRICTTWASYLPNLGLALLLLGQVLANYLAAVTLPAGRVQDMLCQPGREPGGYIAQGSYDCWTWCSACSGPKPPNAHHCSKCKACVVEQDHHCIFIQNCVGRGNLRPFLLFLIWALMAASYIAVMCSLLVATNWRLVRASLRPGGLGAVFGGSGGGSSDWHGAGSHSAAAAAAAAADGGSSSSSSSRDGWASQPAVLNVWAIAAMGLFVLLLEESPWWLLAAYYLLAVAFAVLLSLGVLLCSQLYYLGLGITYIDHIKAQREAGGGDHPSRTHHKGQWRLGQRAHDVVVHVQYAWQRLWEVLGGPRQGGKRWRALFMPGQLSAREKSN